MNYEFKVVLENKATKKINASAIKDFDFHINEMKKHIKWYKKLPSIMINFATSIFAFSSYVAISVFFCQFLITGNDNVLSIIVLGFMHVFLFYFLVMNESSEEESAVILTLKAFLFLDFNKRYLHVLEDCSEHELSLESMRRIADYVSSDELKEILNHNGGIITYSDIFKSSIPYIYNSIEYKKYSNVKKVKADVLVDQIYEEKKVTGK